MRYTKLNIDGNDIYVVDIQSDIYTITTHYDIDMSKSTRVRVGDKVCIMDDEYDCLGTLDDLSEEIIDNIVPIVLFKTSMMYGKRFNKSTTLIFKKHDNN